MTFQEWKNSDKAGVFRNFLPTPRQWEDVERYAESAWHARDAEISELNLTISTLREQLGNQNGGGK